MSTKTTTFVVYGYNLKFESGCYQTDGMADPMIYGDGFATKSEAIELFEELRDNGEARDRFITETRCGGHPQGYAVAVEAETFEDDEFVESETIEWCEYTFDDYKAEN